MENHPEHLNTPRLVADSTGTTVWRWDQAEPFGVNTPDENPSALGAFELPLRLPGQYADKETNTHYNMARDYDPTIGRYVQSDPVGLVGGVNTYAYVGSDPIRFVDPHGDVAIIPIVQGLAIVARYIGYYVVGMAGINAYSGASLCMLETEARDLALSALLACQRARNAGLNCDCAQEIEQLRRAEQRQKTACVSDFGGNAGTSATQTGRKVPGMATK